MHPLTVDGNELDQKTVQNIDSTVSGFLGRPSTVTEIVPPPTGRSRRGNQYRITTDGHRRISVKRAHSHKDDLRWEMFHADMRQLLELPHYKVERRTGFPLRGWEREDCVLIDWGVVDRRLDLDDCRVRQRMKDGWQSLGPLGQMAAQNIVFATGDRKNEHLVWDLDENVMFSIDHEILGRPSEITMYFNRELRSLYGQDWRASPHKQANFQAEFVAVWGRAELHADRICESYTKHGLAQSRLGFSKRLSQGHSYFLQQMLR